jgi:NAD(P)-dependent dehydrogenase (short-subunit alcohol dehydrogenase family)
MTTETALVTGGTDGIGKAIALGLARTGLEVVVVGRDRSKGARAESDLRRSSGNDGVHFVPADLSLTGEADRLAAEVIRGHPRLSYLVHSAGIVFGRWALTAEGVESNFAVNYLGRFALTQRLLPLLTESARPNRRSRVLLVNGAATNGTIHFDDVNLTRSFGTVRAILQCCQANDAFTVECADRLTKRGEQRVSVNCIKVGVVRTNIRRHFPAWMKWLVPLVMDPLFALPAEQVAARALQLLVAPEFESVTGALFTCIRRFKAIDIPLSIREEEMRRRLWELSERLTASNPA